MLFMHLLRQSYDFYISFYQCGVLHLLICVSWDACIPEINPAWSWYMILLLCSWIQFVNILLRKLSLILTVFILYTGLDEAQAGIKIAGRNINNLRYADDTTLMAESEEELKSLLMQVKEETEKAALKFNIQKTKIMASGLITSWQINGETVADFIFGGSKITADGDCSHEIERCLLLGRKAMTNLDSILKSILKTFANKFHIVKAMLLPFVKYGC